MRRVSVDERYGQLASGVEGRQAAPMESGSLSGNRFAVFSTRYPAVATDMDDNLLDVCRLELW